jgi:hypothetical protein
MPTPSQPRTTAPCASSDSTTGRTIAVGIAKPMPTLPP